MLHQDIYTVIETKRVQSNVIIDLMFGVSFKDAGQYYIKGPGGCDCCLLDRNLSCTVKK